MDERVKFISEVLKGGRKMSELCQQYGISRKTGYKWVDRYESGGPAALEDLGRRPQNCAHATPESVVKEILEMRYRYPTWGARKLLAKLEQAKGDTDWPAASTINAILRRAGLVQARKRRRRVTPSASPLGEITAPNQLWCMDFKGFFRCGNKERCDPFTITDAFSRYIIRCQAVPSLSYGYVDAVCDAAMREFGMPERIRTDNGTPFATTSVLGLSRLSAKWKRLAITHERIEPGEPQQNGRHERMHRTLKEETANPPAFTLREQQDRFDEFRRCFNETRPHQALSFATPSSVYVASTRKLPSEVPEPQYSEAHLVRKIKKSGDIKIGGGRVYLTEALSDEFIGLLETEKGIYEVYFCDLLLGKIDTFWNGFERVR